MSRTSEQVTISMDWMPTLLAAAGVLPDADYPPDGIDLLPLLRDEASARPRKLFWRFKSNAQRSVRDGDFKWLRIRENSFLFNVVDDPLERANLRDRHREVFDRLAREWEAWNTAMLPEVPESATAILQPADVADRYGLSTKP